MEFGSGFGFNNAISFDNFGAFTISQSASTPFIFISALSINFPNTEVGQNSNPEVVNVIGANLLSDITVTGDTNFQLSLDTVNYFTSLTLPQSDGNVNAIVYVRFSPSAEITYTSVIEYSATSAVSKYTNVSGAGTLPIPFISVDSSINFPETQVGQTSASQIVKVTGGNLLSDIEVTGDTNFQLSLDDINYSKTLTLPQSGGIVNTLIYIRFEPTEENTYAFLIEYSALSAASQYTEVSGTGFL